MKGPNRERLTLGGTGVQERHLPAWRMRKRGGYWVKERAWMKGHVTEDQRFWFSDVRLTVIPI